MTHGLLGLGRFGVGSALCVHFGPFSLTPGLAMVSSWFVPCSRAGN